MHVQISNKHWLIIQFIQQIRGHISNNIQNIVKNVCTLQKPIMHTEKNKGKMKMM